MLKLKNIAFSDLFLNRKEKFDSFNVVFDSIINSHQLRMYECPHELHHMERPKKNEQKPF